MANPNDDDSQQVGRPSPTSYADLVAAIRDAMATTGAPFATTDDVTERVEIKERTVRQKLNELADDGEIHSRRIGSGRVWWLADEDREQSS